jgi:hypothetical protein
MKRVNIERRKHPRTERTLPLKISKEGLDAITETRNVSCSGVYCRVNKMIPLMSKIGLTLLLPIYSGKKLATEKIRCGGVVVRSEPEIVQGADTAYQNIAIFFTDLTRKDRDKIAQYVFQSFQKRRF